MRFHCASGHLKLVSKAAPRGKFERMNLLSRACATGSGGRFVFFGIALRRLDSKGRGVSTSAGGTRTLEWQLVAGRKQVEEG